MTDKDARHIEIPSRLIFRLAPSVGLCLGFLDVLLGSLTGRSTFPDLQSILSPIAVTTTTFSFLYAVGCLLLASILKRIRGFAELPLAISIALFLVLFFLLASLNDLLTYSVFSPEKLTQLLILGLIACGLAGLIYIALKTIATQQGFLSYTLTITAVTPFLLGVITFCVWLHSHRIQPSHWLANLTAVAIYAGVSLLGTVLFAALTASARTWLLNGASLAILLSPFAAALQVSIPTPSRHDKQKLEHKIKHVILITVDTLRPDFLTCYGNQQRAYTPNIDALAHDGLLFENAISPASWTLPSLASIMTGLPPHVHLVTSRQSRLADNFKTMPEYLQDAGYFTAAIGRNEFLSPKHNLSQGFADYNVFPRSGGGDTFGALLLRALCQSVKPLPVRARDLILRTLADRVSTDDLTTLAASWLERNRQKDFFLWIHYFDPHYPYAPPAEFLPRREPPTSIGRRFSRFDEVRGGYFIPSPSEREWIKELYSAEINYVDSNIGELLGVLKGLGLYENSLIVFASDHGEEFWEHGGYEHGHSLYQELLRVPLIVKLPFSISVAGRITRRVSSQAVMPTVLDLCGINPPSLAISPLLRLGEQNASNHAESPIFCSGVLYFDDKEAVIFEGKKYIRSRLGFDQQLFDLARDPQEQVTTISSSPRDAERARNLLKDFDQATSELRKSFHLKEGEKVTLDKETIRRLKSLGYMK